MGQPNLLRQGKRNSTSRPSKYINKYPMVIFIWHIVMPTALTRIYVYIILTPYLSLISFLLMLKDLTNSGPATDKRHPRVRRAAAVTERNAIPVLIE